MFVKRKLQRFGPLTARRVLEVIDQTVEDWVRQQGTEHDIRQKVRSQLTKFLDDMIKFAVGINRDSFSRIEIDSRSPGMPILRQHLEAAARDWIEHDVGTTKPVFTDAELVELRRWYAREYDTAVRKELSKAAMSRAVNDATDIVNSVGFSTDAMRDALKDLLQDEQKEEATREAARGREFLQRTKLKTVRVIGVVAYDGTKISELIQEPDATCWHVVQLESVFAKHDCYVLVNGQEWHPLSVSFKAQGQGNRVVDYEKSEVMPSFTSSSQLIFNFLDEADRLAIVSALQAHYRRKPSDEEDDEIPF